MKMLWDEKALYIAAEITEPHVWATLTDHDAVIFHDPDFEVFLDPDGDNHLYGELELNAKNTTWDLLLTKPYKDGGQAINAWEIIGLKTAVHVNGTLNDPTRQGHRVDGRDRVAVGRAERAGEGRQPRRRTATAGGSTSAASSGTSEVKDGKYVKIPKRAGTQLGVVAAGGDRHAPPGAVGVLAVQHESGRGEVPAGPGAGGERPAARPCTTPNWRTATRPAST